MHVHVRIASVMKSSPPLGCVGGGYRHLYGEVFEDNDTPAPIQAAGSNSKSVKPARGRETGRSGSSQGAIPRADSISCPRCGSISGSGSLGSGGRNRGSHQKDIPGAGKELDTPPGEPHTPPGEPHTPPGPHNKDTKVCPYLCYDNISAIKLNDYESCKCYAKLVWESAPGDFIVRVSCVKVSKNLRRSNLDIYIAFIIIRELLTLEFLVPCPFAFKTTVV